MSGPSTLPLYAGSREAPEPRERPHAGLWYDKFASKWKGLEGLSPEFGKAEWTAAFARATGNGVWDLDLLGEAVERQRRLAAALGGQVLLLTSTARFVTGLGRSHPVENGFAWHPTLGTPYLPGSGLKGVLKSWLEWSREGEAYDRRDEILGAPETVGSVAFLDLLPVGPPHLVADIMTPHYADYYQDGKTPGDWMSPVPIPFLAVEAGQSWQCVVLAGRRDGGQGESLAKLAAAALAEALAWLGAGAKTAVGYGRFEVDEAGTQRLEAERDEARLAAEERARLKRETAGLSPLAVEFHHQRRDNAWDTVKDAFVQTAMYGGWMERLEGNPDPAALRMMRELVDRHFPGLLSDPDRMEGKKNKPVFKDRQREFARRFNALGG
ncbi:MAG: type III-B CRISPR module RAMP protein Cmr6 [Chloroflexi bacterium]|jgi:CRISPR-associated protein Cmr6|nr:type III-B CRISPR module RAMP protein Cmr6 [Chloroflexota bacterium]